MLTIESNNDMQATMNCDSQQENNDMQNSFSIESRILETIRQKILMFRYELDDAKIKCYDAKHDQSIHWSIVVERESNVKVLEGKINVLEKLMKEIECMKNNSIIVPM